MLDFVAGMPVALRPDPRGARGLLYKAPKAGQDLRVDLPAIGPETVTRATAAGLGGIAWAAGGVMLIDAAATRAAAERAGCSCGPARHEAVPARGRSLGRQAGRARSWRVCATLAPGTTFDGVGGPLMAAEGLDSLFPMDELSVMGLAEVLPRYPRSAPPHAPDDRRGPCWRRPDALVTIDSPDFALRVAGG